MQRRLGDAEPRRAPSSVRLCNSAATACAWRRVIPRRPLSLTASSGSCLLSGSRMRTIMQSPSTGPNRCAPWCSRTIHDPRPWLGRRNSLCAAAIIRVSRSVSTGWQIPVALDAGARRPRVEHGSPYGIGVVEKTCAAHQKNGVRQFVQDEIRRREFRGHSLLREAKPQRGAKSASKRLASARSAASKSPRDAFRNATTTAQAALSNSVGAAITQWKRCGANQSAYNSVRTNSDFRMTIPSVRARLRAAISHQIVLPGARRRYVGVKLISIQRRPGPESDGRHVLDSSPAPSARTRSANFANARLRAALSSTPS